MATNKDMKKTDSKGPMSNDPNRQSEGQGSNPSMPSDSKQAGASQRHKSDDDEVTAGGRKGQFSDSDRGSKDQWSPGSSQSSDQ